MIVNIDTHQIKTPDSWNELELKQLLVCYQILMSDIAMDFKTQEILPAKRISLTKYLLGLPEEFFRKWARLRIKEDPEDGQLIFLKELEALTAITDFMLEEIIDESDEEDKPKKYQINLALTKCPWPKITFPRVTGKRDYWYAPSDALKNISLYELGVSFTLFENFLSTKNEDIADQLIAVLYRPSKAKTKKNKRSAFEGDRRLPYLKHEDTVAKRQQKIKKLRKEIKQLIIFWFACCRHQIIHSYPNIFTKENTKKAKRANYGWGGVLMSLADGLVNLNQVAGEKYSNALMYLSWLEDQQKEAEQKRKELA